jgi:hypothetical protein
MKEAPQGETLATSAPPPPVPPPLPPPRSVHPDDRRCPSPSTFSGGRRADRGLSGRGWSAALHTPRRTTTAAPSAPSPAMAAGPVLLRPDLLRRPPEKVEALFLRPDLAVTFFLLSSSFLVKSLGSCWLCMQIYEELCCDLVGSCLKTNKSERSCWIFSYEWMLLIRKDEELYNVTEISEQILNFV